MNTTDAYVNNPEHPLGEPHEELSPAQTAIWREIVALVRPGVLTRRHRLFVEVAARALDSYRESQRGLHCPLVYDTLRRMASMLGLAPRVIAKLLGPPPVTTKKAGLCGWAKHHGVRTTENVRARPRGKR